MRGRSEFVGELADLRASSREEAREDSNLRMSLESVDGSRLTTPRCRNKESARRLGRDRSSGLTPFTLPSADLGSKLNSCSYSVFERGFSLDLWRKGTDVLYRLKRHALWIRVCLHCTSLRIGDCNCRVDVRHTGGEHPVLSVYRRGVQHLYDGFDVPRIEKPEVAGVARQSDCRAASHSGRRLPRDHDLEAGC